MGIDGGDVFKEYLTDLPKEVFEDIGLPTRRMNCILAMAPTRQNVSNNLVAL